MLRIISMSVSLIVVVAVYIAANSMPFNGRTTIELLNRLPILFTPASYVFIIWGFILILLAFWIYHFWQTKQNYHHSVLNLRTVLFVLSSIFSVLWIYLWHFEFLHLAVVVTFALLVTLTVLYFTYPKIETHFLERGPISIFLGWVIMLLITITNYDLRFHEWSGFGLSHALWTVIILTIATAIALHFMYHYQDIAFNVVFIWGFIGIVVKNGFDELFVSTAALFLTAVIGVSIFLMKRQHTK